MFENLNLFKFLEQIKQEATKITFPTKQEMVASILIVIAVIVVFSVICMFIDYGIHNIVQLLLRVGN